MQIRIVAVGQRITEWAQSAVSDYLSRFPRDFRVELREIRTEPRAGQTPARLMAAEAERILAAIEPDDFVVVLDEHGKDLTTMDLARHFSHWRADGETPVFVIGGPDGLAPEVKARANLTIRLSSMTLPLRASCSPSRSTAHGRSSQAIPTIEPDTDVQQNDFPCEQEPAPPRPAHAPRLRRSRHREQRPYAHGLRGRRSRPARRGAQGLRAAHRAQQVP